MMITQNELKSQLNYCPETGVFTWLVSNTNSIKVGDIAGSINKSGYSVVRLGSKLNSKLYYAHRLAWLYLYGSFPSKVIDHINGVASDNRICNLRQAHHVENIRSQKIRSDNTTGFKGVTWDKKLCKYRASYHKLGKLRHLGVFDTKEEADRNRQEYAKVFDGAFYRAR